MNRVIGYKPISDYGAIGNMYSVALAGRDGSIDWCCFPCMDDPSVFAAILDVNRGGRFRIWLPDAPPGDQEYVKDSNVLKTRLENDEGIITIIDFMPVNGDISALGKFSAPPEIHRIITCEEGEAEVHMEWSPRFDYGQAEMRIQPHEGGWLATDGNHRLTLNSMADCFISQDDSGPVLTATFRMRKGEIRCVVNRWDSGHAGGSVEESVEKMKETTQIWYDWAHMEEAVHAEDWAEELLPKIIRAELVFKMLTHAETGAMAAAPTTSLPETIGGVRNWDYRYAWIRDASMTAQALISLGHKTEAIDLLNWMEEVSASQHEHKRELQIMYGLKGQADLHEFELSHLEGYRGSAPVRSGNEAAEQFQLETFGEIVSTGYELIRRGESLSTEVMNLIRYVADHVTEVWERPDYGIWEVRGGPRHFTYSKVMAWVALDRAVRLVNEHGLSGDADKWSNVGDAIRKQVLAEGYNEKIGAFTISYDSPDLDAANLRIPLLEFLPADDYRVQNTINQTMKHLVENGLVYRYLTDDGLPGKEGTFGLCSFWLVDALALSGRIEEAREIFSGICGCANHLGLFAEQFDPKTREHLGNFPQAFTHIGLINSVMYLAKAEGKNVPGFDIVGTSTRRASRNPQAGD
jgi:GH15 family glucan-1,4-alpha-glucosidase